MLTKRVISAVIGLIVLLSIILSGNMFIVNIGVFCIIIIALYELFNAVGISKKKSLEYFGYIGAFIVCFNKYIVNANVFKFIILIYIIILLIIMLFYYNKINFTDVSLTLLSIIYISYFLTHIVYIIEYQEGYFLLWFVFLGAWATDTFAYFAGMLMGKHKLIEKISPKKTIEGAVGGILGCVLSFIFVSYILDYFADLSVNYIYVIILGVICSIMAQLGDLIASCIKRQYDIKDFGNIMPGHGGLLDRFDSVILVTPIVYYFVLFFEIFS